MILLCAPLYITDTQVKAGGVVHTLISYGGSGCSVTLEKPNANVLQQVAAFPRERKAKFT